MARWYEPTSEQVSGYAEWVASRPARVRAVAERFTPWTLYRMGRQRVVVVGFDAPWDEAPVTLKVDVLGQFNAIAFERTVFGVDPGGLVECELPTATDPVGVLFDGIPEAWNA